MPAKIALNVITDTIQDIDDLDDGGKFVTHKPRMAPYQAPDFKSRVLWVHTSAGYVVWMAGGKLLLVPESAVPQGDNDTHSLAVGEYTVFMTQLRQRSRGNTARPQVLWRAMRIIMLPNSQRCCECPPRSAR